MFACSSAKASGGSTGIRELREVTVEGAGAAQMQDTLTFALLRANREIAMTRVRMTSLLAACVLTVARGELLAQDAVQAAPNHFTVLLENERVRVLDFHSKSGETVAMHSHPAYISYSISGSGKTRFTRTDGKVTEQPARAGQAVWHDAETHASEYIGTGEAHVLLIELKGQAPPKQ